MPRNCELHPCVFALSVDVKNVAFITGIPVYIVVSRAYLRVKIHGKILVLLLILKKRLLEFHL